MDFEKEVKNDRALIEQIHRMSYYQKHYINICGECEKKANIFNDLGKRKIDIEKEQLVLICIGKLWENDLTFDDIIEKDKS